MIEGSIDGERFEVRANVDWVWCVHPFTHMKYSICLLAAAVSAGTVLGAEKMLVHSFTKQVLTKEFWSEGATYGDFNKDGNVDIAAGPFWYEGPKFEKRHEFYPATHHLPK